MSRSVATVTSLSSGRGKPLHAALAAVALAGAHLPAWSQPARLKVAAVYTVPVELHGLALRMVGENPAAAAAEGQGLDVAAVRIGAVVAGLALMGAAGAFLTLAAYPQALMQPYRKGER